MCFWTAYKLSQYCHLWFLCFGQFVLMPLCFQGEIFLFFCSLKCDQYEAICLFYALLYLLLRMPFGFAVVIHTSLFTGDFSFYFSAYYSKKAQKFNVSLHAIVNELVNFPLVPPRFSSTYLSLSNSSYHPAPHFPRGGMLALNRCTLPLKFTSLSCELNDPRGVTRRVVLSTNINSKIEPLIISGNELNGNEIASEKNEKKRPT